MTIDLESLTEDIAAARTQRDEDLKALDATYTELRNSLSEEKERNYEEINRRFQDLDAAHQAARGAVYKTYREAVIAAGGDPDHY